MKKIILLCILSVCIVGGTQIATTNHAHAQSSIEDTTGKISATQEQSETTEMSAQERLRFLEHELATEKSRKDMLKTSFGLFVCCALLLIVAIIITSHHNKKDLKNENKRLDEKNDELLTDASLESLLIEDNTCSIEELQDMLTGHSHPVRLGKFMAHVIKLLIDSNASPNLVLRKLGQWGVSQEETNVYYKKTFQKIFVEQITLQSMIKWSNSLGNDSRKDFDDLFKTPLFRRFAREK